MANWWLLWYVFVWLLQMIEMIGFADVCMWSLDSLEVIRDFLNVPCWMDSKVTTRKKRCIKMYEE